MIRTGNLRAAAAIAVVSAAPWLGAAARTPAAPAPTADAVVLCVGPDSVLRAAPAGRGCPVGQKPAPVAASEVRSVGCANCDPWSSTAQPPRAESSPEVADLEQRLDALEQAPLFEVVDRQGNDLFIVSREGASVFNAADVRVAMMRATGEGGYFTALSSDGSKSASTGATTTTVGLRLSEGGVPRLDAQGQAGGTYSMKVRSLNTAGDPLAGLGQSKAGGGAVVVADEVGSLRAWMTVVDGKGSISVFNKGGDAILDLTQGATGGGLLAIGNASREPMVKMGVKDDRYGIVLTGPKAGLPYVPRSGLPGSYFMGCAGGEGCQR